MQTEYSGRQRGVLFRGHRNAFTLIELVLVIVIIALLTALAIPSFVSTLQSQKLDSAASTVASMCQEARFAALFGNHTCWYVIDLDKQNVRLLQEPSANTNEVSTYEEIAAETNIIDSATAEVKDIQEIPTDIQITGVQIQNGTEQTTGVIGLPFYNNGVSEPFRVFLQNVDGEKRAIDIDMFTAKAKVFTPL